MAAKLHKADPTLTTEQHFAKLAEDPRNSQLLAKAVRFTVEEVDDEDDDDEDDDGPDVCDDPELDPTPANDPGRGMPAPTAAEARTNSGRSEAPYNADGDNLRQTTTRPAAAPPTVPTAPG